MSGLIDEISARALELGIPLSVQVDLTYRCNERCVHCYLDHEDHGEMTTGEITSLFDQLADAGVLFLTLSGGEILMRKDFFEILEHARARTFSVKLKTNAVMIRRKEAERIRSLGVHAVQISIYSHRPEVHDLITRIPGSFERSVRAIRFLRASGLNVTISSAPRPAIRSTIRPNASRLVGSVQCASSKIINTGFWRVSASTCETSASIVLCRRCGAVRSSVG